MFQIKQNGLACGPVDSADRPRPGFENVMQKHLVDHPGRGAGPVAQPGRASAFYHRIKDLRG